MIAYEELVSALALWRERNGLPVGSADYLGSPPAPEPISFGAEDDGEGDYAVGDQMIEGAYAVPPDGDYYGDDHGDVDVELDADGELSADDAIIGESVEVAPVEVADAYPSETIEPYGDQPYAADGEEAIDEVAIGDDAIIGESEAPPPPPQSGPDDATAPQDFHDDPSLLAAGDASADNDEVAFISAGVPSDDLGGAEEPVREAEAAVEPDLSEYPPLDATAQGIAPAPPAPGSSDMTLDQEDYPSVSDDPTVEGFRPLSDDEGGDGSGQPPA